MDNHGSLLVKKSYLILLILLIVSFYGFSQSVNDYRSIASGNWTNSSVWEVYNGTNWVPATSYPGQITGTNDVSIIGGYTVALNSTIPNSFNSLTVGDGSGGLDTLEIANTSSLDTLLITINDGGYASWTSNVTLFLPAGAAVVIIPSGSLDTSKPCSAAKRIQIGTIIYSTCNGGAGAEYSFEDLNTAGGSLNVSPTSNSPVCEGNTLTLFANGSGTGSDSATYSWTGSGPGGYSFSSSLENPIEAGLTAGSYTFTVTITSGSIFNSNSVNVTVAPSPNPPISGGNQTACTTGTIPTITASVNTGETVDWYDTSTGGNLLLSDNTNFTPTASGSYFAEARSTSSGCISNTRTEIIISLKSCIIITNRQITYRVNN